jgi:hypothetical protein
VQGEDEVEVVVEDGAGSLESWAFSSAQGPVGPSEVVAEAVFGVFHEFEEVLLCAAGGGADRELEGLWGGWSSGVVVAGSSGAEGDVEFDVEPGEAAGECAVELVAVGGADGVGHEFVGAVSEGAGSGVGHL